MDKNKMDKKGLGLMFELLCIVLVPVVFVGGFCLLSLRNVGKRTSTKVMLHELEAMEYSVESSLKLIQLPLQKQDLPSGLHERSHS